MFSIRFLSQSLLALTLSSVAFADTVAPVTSAPPPIVSTIAPGAGGGACVSSIEDRCVLTARNGTIGIMLQSNGILSLRMMTATDGSTKGRVSGVDIRRDLADKISPGRYNFEEAGTINKELSRLDGAAYKIPAFVDLVKSIGLPRDLYFADQDTTEFVRIHLQMTWSVQPMTAMYLTEFMGLKVVPARDTAVKIHAEPVVETASPAPVVAPVLAPAAKSVGPVVKTVSAPETLAPAKTTSAAEVAPVDAVIAPTTTRN